LGKPGSLAGPLEGLLGGAFAGGFAGFFLGGPAGFLAPGVGDDRRRGASEEAEGASEERPNASSALESGDELGECCAHGPAAAFLAKASCCISSLGMAERPSKDDEAVSLLRSFSDSTALISDRRAALTREKGTAGGSASAGCRLEGSAGGPLPVAGCARDGCEASAREEEEDLASTREAEEGECCAKGPGPRASRWMT